MFLSSAVFCCCFFKSTFSKISLRIPSECQTVWVQIRPDKTSGLIWVQTVCKGYQHTTKVGKELNGLKIMPFNAFVDKNYLMQHIYLCRGKFNNASALGRSLYWCQALHIMNKDRYQSTSARRALALLNSPQVRLYSFNFVYCRRIWPCHLLN